MSKNQEYSCCEEHGQFSIGKPMKGFSVNVYDAVTRKQGTFTDKDMSGKWTVFMFYPADFTYVCATELKELSRISTTFGDKVNVLAGSTDTVFSHEVYHNYDPILKDVNYRFIGDNTAELSSYFGIYNSETGLDFRGTFIVNPNKEVVASEVQFYNVGRSIDELIRKLHAFMYAFEHPNEVVPCEWKPGKATLKPAELTVGKIGDSYKE